MTPGLMGMLALAPMVLLLVLLAIQDVRSHRISNKLVLIGMLSGVVLNGVLPEGWGFNSVIPGALGWLAAIQGIAIGILGLLPLYWLRAMGAGDVKLMGMVGAFLGPSDVIGAMLATFVVGGVVGLVVVLWSRRLAHMLENIKFIVLGSVMKLSAGQAPLIDNSADSVGNLPYAIAITLGTFAYLIWQRM